MFAENLEQVEKILFHARWEVVPGRKRRRAGDVQDVKPILDVHAEDTLNQFDG